jgi:hypothetical protein
MDMISLAAVDRAEHALAEPRRILDDPIEHRLDAGRRVRDQAQDLGCRGLPLPGFLQFDGKLLDFRGGILDVRLCDVRFCGHCLGAAGLRRGRRAAFRFGWSVASFHCLPQVAG